MDARSSLPLASGIFVRTIYTDRERPGPLLFSANRLSYDFSNLLLSLMYNSILIPVDLSSTNEYVLDTAQQLGTADRTHIQLLHVIETLHDEEPSEMDDFYEELREDAEEKMEAWAGKLAEKNFEVQSTIVYGERGPEVTRVAEEEDVDLVVMRSHKIDRDDPDSNIGSVSHQVAVFAPCSVYLVRP